MLLKRFRCMNLLFVLALVGLSAGAQEQDRDNASLLQEMMTVDSMFLSGFTATGATISVPWGSSSRPPFRLKWTLSTRKGEIAYQEESTEFLPWSDIYPNAADIPPKMEGNHLSPYRTTIYFGAELSANHSVLGLPTNDALRKWKEDHSDLAPGVLRMERPDALTYTRRSNITLWALGRCYSKYLSGIEEQSTRPDGLIEAKFNAIQVGGRQQRWELVIDPSSMYMVRSAKRYLGAELDLEFRNSGSRWIGTCLLPEKMEFVEHTMDPPVTFPFTVEHADFRPDDDLLQRSATLMQPPYPQNFRIIDYRNNLIEAVDPDQKFQEISPEEANLFQAVGEQFPLNIAEDINHIDIGNTPDDSATSPRDTATEMAGQIDETVEIPEESNPIIVCATVVFILALAGLLLLLRSTRKRRG